MFDTILWRVTNLIQPVCWVGVSSVDFIHNISPAGVALWELNADPEADNAIKGGS